MHLNLLAKCMLIIYVKYKAIRIRIPPYHNPEPYDDIRFHNR